MVLFQDGHALLFRDDDLAGSGLQVAGEDAQKRGLTSAVGTDDAIAVAGDKFQIHMLEKRLTAEVHADVIDSNHGFHSFSYEMRTGAEPPPRVCVSFCRGR